VIRKLAAAFLAFTLFGSPAFAQGSHSRGTSHRSASTKSSTRKARTKKAPYTLAARDSHGRIRRSQHARAEFMRQTGYPHGRHGYVVDHIVPLACGGADAPYNMQWQTVAAAKAKDKTERQACR
jgi:hypothetical protein